MNYLKRYDSETVAQRKYNHLLIGMVVLFLVAPLYLRTNLKFPLIMFIFFAIVQLALRATIDNKKLLLLYRLLVLAALGCTLLSECQSIGLGLGNFFYAVGRAVYVIFLVLTIRVFIGRILVAERITVDRIRGGICLYVLAGIVWSFLYEIIYLFDSASFRLESVNRLSFLYYSYSTLTSLGLGDITPTNDFAISLTCLEAISGQMFLAVFIARLVGLHVVQRHKQMDS